MSNGDDIVVIQPEAFHTQHQLRTRTGDGKDLVVSSGYAEIDGSDLQGNPDGTWNRRDLVFNVGPRWAPLNDTVPVVSMSSIMNSGVANNAGWAVDDCRVEEVNDPEGGIVIQFARLRCRVAVRDSDGFMFRVNFYVTQIGQLA